MSGRWIRKPTDNQILQDWGAWLGNSSKLYRDIGTKFEYDCFGFLEQEAVSLLLLGAGKTGLLGLSEGYVDKSGDRYGRYDLWLSSEGRDYYFEFKLAYRDRVQSPWNLENSMQVARTQIGGWNVEPQARRFAVVLQRCGSNVEGMHDMQSRVLNQADFAYQFDGGSIGDATAYFKEVGI